jgi:hypothetical protein
MRRAMALPQVLQLTEWRTVPNTMRKGTPLDEGLGNRASFVLQDASAKMEGNSNPR